MICNLLMLFQVQTLHQGYLGLAKRLSFIKSSKCDPVLRAGYEQVQRYFVLQAWIRNVQKPMDAKPMASLFNGNQLDSLESLLLQCSIEKQSGHCKKLCKT